VVRLDIARRKGITQPGDLACPRREGIMTAMQTVEHVHGGVTFRSRLALPAGRGPHPGVMVMHDGRGVGDFVCDRARRLAEAGYAALAVDMHGEGRFYADTAEGSALVMAMMADTPRLRARVVAAFEAFAALPQVDPARIGAIGFCYGGQCVLELARSGANARAVVSFHGVLTTQQPARPGEVKAGVLVLTGALDPFAPVADVEAFRAEMTAAQADWQVTTYGGALHGFTDPIADEMQRTMPGVGYDPVVDKLSRAQSMAFLEAALRG
jgi:dienelactone hydrolase